MMNSKSSVIWLKNNRTVIMFWIIFAAAILIRIVRFGSLPYGVNQDEAMGAVDAWALSKYGTDRFGVRLPVHFSAWQVSQMSVLLSYLMIPFIKIFGFHTWVIRLPMLLSSIGSVALMYLIGKKIAGERMGLAAMALTAINPWHFMQSRWAIDCNLFPHVFLLAFYLLLLGIEKRKYLYLSMFFFGLTFYCYGIAVYSVTPFLAVFAIWGFRQKLFSVKEVLLSIVIFGITALPEILVMAVNLFHLDTIDTGFITISRFPETLRGNDILFMNFSFGQLFRNIWFTIKSSFLQLPDYWFNTIPAFGPMYHISIPFMLGGIAMLTREVLCPKYREKEIAGRAFKLALWGFVITGIWVGIITYEVNVNRINIIFFALILTTAYCICRFTAKDSRRTALVAAVYALCGIMFIAAYFTVYPAKSAQYYNGEFLQTVREADASDTDSLYITGNMGWQFNLSMAEILTQYTCEIDAEYFQGETAVTGGRQLLPYPERYHYINAQLFDWGNCDTDALYILNEADLAEVDAEYRVVSRTGQFYVLEIQI